MNILADVRALIIDMDGVLWHGNQPLPGLETFFKTLRDRHIRFILATNNASLTAEQYVAKLGRMGVEVAREEILTSGMATALYLTEHADPRVTKVFVIGEDGLRQPLAERGFTLTGLYEIEAQYVTCGMDHGISWDKLATASLNIRAGAKFIGTNGDTTFPTERGLTHGNGAILAALQVGTGVAPTVIGKPEPIMYQQAMSLLGADPAETVAVGDRLETDILGAIRAGLRSLLVLSGISTQADVERTTDRPTWVLPDIGAIAKALRS